MFNLIVAWILLLGGPAIYTVITKRCITVERIIHAFKYFVLKTEKKPYFYTYNVSAGASLVDFIFLINLLNMYNKFSAIGIIYYFLYAIIMAAVVVVLSNLQKQYQLIVVNQHSKQPLKTQDDNELK